VSATLQQLLLQNLESQQSQYRLWFEQLSFVGVHSGHQLDNLLKYVFILVQERKERRFLKMVGFHLIES
jgi:hypothetical protein